MGLSLEVWRSDDGYLLIDVSGEYSLFGFKELTKRARAEAREQDVSKLLIDLSRVSGDIEPWEGEHLGAYVGLSSEHRLTTAIVAQPNEVASAFQRAALDQAIDLRVFSDRAAAVAWLLSC